MPKAAQVNIGVTNLTQNVEVPSSGVNFVMGQSVRGPFANPETLITSWQQFVSIFGGLLAGSDAPLMCKRLLERGGAVRFSRVGHYTDPTNASTLDAVKASHPDAQLITFDGPLVASNDIDATLNGDNIATVTFATSNDATLVALAAAFEALDDVASAVALDKGNSGDTEDNRQIMVVPVKGAELDITAITVTGGASQAVDTVTTLSSFIDKDGNNLFDIVPKYAGADANDFKVEITAGSNGGAAYFDLILTHTTDGVTVETYRNLTIDEFTTAANATFLDAVVNGSSFFDVVYKDLSALTGVVVPVAIEAYFYNGSDGSAVVDADYTGDSNAKTGFFAFDAYDDAYNIGVFDNGSDAVHIAGSSYAANRGDLVYFLEIPLTYKTQTQLIAQRDAYLVDSKYTYIYAGGLKIKDPITSQDKEILSMGDVMALANNTAKDFGEWRSFAGNQNGLITGALGVVNNFGAAGNFGQLNALAQRQINMVILRDNAIKLWGNFSAQLKDDQEKFINIVRLVLFLKKSLRPTLENFLEQPNDIPTWKQIYYTVKPFLDGLKTDRAIFSYDWQGDQDAANLQSLTINNPTDVTNGIYKVNLAIKAIASVQEINVDIILTPGGISFDVISELT